MPGRTRLIAIATLALAALFLAACDTATIPVTRLVEVDKEVTKEIEVTRIVVQEKEVEQTRIVTVEVTPTPTPIPTGGYLITALSEDAETFNPIFAIDDSSIFVSSLLYGGMFQTDPHTGEPTCHFCSSWESTDRTFTFALRDDIVWSDGEPVSVDDFIYTYSALLWGVANETLASSHREAVEAIDSITRIDQWTVAVTMQDQDCVAIMDLDLGWLPQHVYGPRWEVGNGVPVTLLGPFGDADDPDFSSIESYELNHAPAVSSGPFLYREWIPGDHITLVRNPSYFKGTPYLDGLVARVVPDKASQVQMLRTGELDLVERFDPRYRTEVELMEQLAVYKVLDDSYVYLGLQHGDPNSPQPRWLEDADTGEMVFNEAHGQHPILSDQRVRQAIDLGIDRRDIINQSAMGQGVPLYSNLLPSLSWAYNQELEPRSYDPEEAAALLDEAGWVLNEGTGIRAKDGRPLQLDLTTNLSSVKRIQIGEQIQEQLNQLGFDISFEALEWGAFVGLMLGQQFDMVIISWTNLSNNPDDALFFGSENDVPGRGFNFVSYYNPTLDELWRQAATLPGCLMADRGVLYRQIQATLHDELPYSWLYAPLSLTGASKRLKGIDPGPWGTWYNVETWYLANG